MKDLKELDLWDQADEGDPLDWLRKHRDENARKYPTIRELSEYLRTTPPAEEIMADLKQKIKEKYHS